MRLSAPNINARATSTTVSNLTCAAALAPSQTSDIRSRYVVVVDDDAAAAASCGHSTRGDGGGGSSAGGRTFVEPRDDDRISRRRSPETDDVFIRNAKIDRHSAAESCRRPRPTTSVGPTDGRTSVTVAAGRLQRVCACSRWFIARADTTASSSS